MLYFNPNGQTDNVVDAQKAYTSDGTLYFKNNGYNANIEPNKSVSFSYMVDDCKITPDYFVLCQERNEKETGYDVKLKVNQSWGNSFDGEIILQNNTDAAIESWELIIDTNFTIKEITNSWAADVAELEPYSYKLKGTYTGTVPAHSSVSLGFIGVMDGTPNISNFSLSEVVADEKLIETVNHCFDECDTLDSDSDGLPDCSELRVGTDSFNPDTDGDGLTDGDEVYIYGTNALNPDTDNDGLIDSDEGYNSVFYTKYGIYFDPFDPDTDRNGVLDSSEIINQTVEKSLSFDSNFINEISVNCDSNNNIENLMKVRSAEITDPLAAEAIGIIGEPINISMPEDKIFESEGDVTLKLNSQNLETINVENLLLLWHDEKSDQLYELETYYNDSDYTITASVPNVCSSLLLVEADLWHDVYKSSTVFGSSVYNLINDTGLTWAESKKYCENLGGHLVTVSSQEEQDYLIRLMQNYGTSYTYWLGYRYINEYEGIEPHWESINGEGMPYTNWGPGEPNSLYNEAVAHMFNRVPSNLIDIGAKRGHWNDTLDKQDFNYEYSYLNSGIICEFDSTVDTDNDGIPDVLETAGMVTKNGKIIYTDPNNPDTDGDGKTDGEEMIMECRTDRRTAYLNPGQEYLFDDPENYTLMPNGKIKGEISFVYFDYNSDPTFADIAYNSELSISDDVTVIPDIIEGKAVSIKSGTISSNYNIKSVTVGIYSSETGGEVLTYGTAKPNKTYYDISELDNDILFNKLSGGHTYYFRVTAEDELTSKILVNQPFNVSSLSQSSLSIEGVKHIPDIFEGEAVSIKGTIKVDDNDVIKSVLVGVYSAENGGQAYTEKSAVPNSKEFDISDLDNFILFNKVTGGGTRYFRVVATDSSGVTKTLVNQPFEVKKVSSGNPNTPSSEIERILNNIKNSSTINSYGSEAVESCCSMAEIMLENGYETSFVAGMLGNICHEGRAGQFEWYNPEQDYMIYMKNNYNYIQKYSGEYIYDGINLTEVYSILDELNQNATLINAQWWIGDTRVGFGLGAIQWTFERTYNLANLYREVVNNRDYITKSEVIEAERQMVLRELNGYYIGYDFSNLYKDWYEVNVSNINSANAAYDAASDLCLSYERPSNKYNQAVIRGNDAYDIYNEIK